MEIDYFIIQLFNSGKINNILISGGNGQLLNNGYMESEWSKDFLINWNIWKNILIENKSRNTWENEIHLRCIKEDRNKKLLQLHHPGI